jgi:hypothetical protein
MKAFLIVGHSNWGKSQTLRKLTSNSRRIKYFDISGANFFVRRMSNDDDEKKLLKFVSDATKYKMNLIVAFCPVFDKNRESRKILDILSKDFSLFFFVLKHKYASDLTISDDETNVLRDFGDVSLYNKRNEAAKSRAKAFGNYIDQHI